MEPGSRPLASVGFVDPCWSPGIESPMAHQPDPDPSPRPAATPAAASPEPEPAAGAPHEHPTSVVVAQVPTRSEALHEDVTVIDDLAQSLDTATSEEERDEAAEALRARIHARMAEADAAQIARPDPLIGAEIAGRFTVVEKIGEGGMGAVYRARQKGMDRDVAVKALLRQMSGNESVTRRFHLEALAVSKLRHPNTIQIFDFGETDAGQLYIAMEYLEGLSLHECLHREGALAPKRALKIALQIAKSLREAHSKGIVHRDLKPDNVFLVTVGEEPDFVKVLDFGVAKLREQDKSQATLTKAGAIFGTPRYMSPEQSTSATNADHRSDLYSIGVMLFEMLTGRAPFESDNPLGLLIKHVQEPPPPFVTRRPDLVIPGLVEQLTRRLLAKRPEDRPQTAEALIREIEKVDGELDDLFRRVVTCEYAESIGLELQQISHTQLDTQLESGGPMGHATMGSFDDETLYSEPRTSRRRWIAVAAGIFLGVVAGGGAVVYGSLEKLPEAYYASASLSEITVGSVPALVHVGVVSEPPGVEVTIGEEKHRTPFALQRPKGASELAYAAVAEGFLPKSGSLSFTDSADVTIALAPVPKVEAPPVEVEPVDPPPSDVKPADGGEEKPDVATTDKDKAKSGKGKSGKGKTGKAAATQGGTKPKATGGDPFGKKVGGTKRW